MSFKLPGSIISADDARNILQVLETAEAATGKVAATSDASVDLISLNQALYDKLGVVEFTKAYQEAIKSAPCFGVILATEPHDSFLLNLSNWFRQNLHPNALLEVSVRRSIGGGIVVRSKNRIFDFSLRPRLLAARSRFTEVLSHV